MERFVDDKTVSLTADSWSRFPPLGRRAIGWLVSCLGHRRATDRRARGALAP